VDPTNPQSWNRYAYVVNNPLAAVDLNGLCDSNELWTPVNGENSQADANPPGPCTSDPAGDANSFFNAAIGQSHAEDMGRYQSMVDCGFNPGSCDSPRTPNGISIWVYCGGSLSAISCHPPTQAIDGSSAFLWQAANNQPSWWGAYAKSLFSWRNFSAGFKEGGCFRQFAEEAFDPAADIAGQDAAIKATAQSGAYVAATAYAVQQGLVVPMRSSIVRGILDFGEFAGEAAALIPTIYEEGKALKNEVNSFANGECQ
jgi:hypothetical protein